MANKNLPHYMNDYFSNFGAHLAEVFDQAEKNVAKANECPIVLPLFETSEIELSQSIKELNISKSSAIEHLSTKVLQEAFMTLLPRPVRLFKISFIKGYIPDCWKCAIVVPLHKGGDTMDVNNFRLFLLLPIQEKLIEKIVRERMMSHFEANLILDNN